MSPGHLEGGISAVHGEGSLTYPRKGLVSHVYTNLCYHRQRKSRMIVELTRLWCMHELPILARLEEKSPEGDIRGTVIKPCTIFDRHNAITTIR